MAKKRTIRFKKDFRAFWVFSSFVVIGLVFSAILQLNDYIHQNSVSKDYEKQITQLSGESEKLEVRLSSNNSLGNFNKYVIEEAKNYEKVEVEKIKYIKAPGAELAKR
jgi:valyl-tRNA synthetase